jgi:hypothetical protein
MVRRPLRVIVAADGNGSDPDFRELDQAAAKTAGAR